MAAAVYKRLDHLIPLVMPGLPLHSRHDVFVFREDGSRLRLLVHLPRSKGPCPLVLWMHGGGFSLGMPEMVYGSAGSVFLKDCIVVCPDYSLDPFPRGLEDGYTGLRWLKSRAAVLGGNPDQIFVGGESAGGNLAAAFARLNYFRKQS